MQRWDDIPDEHRRFQSRLMEVYAGFAEHTDHQYGKVLDELEAQGELDNTLVFYINSDNGASAEGLFGTISEILCHNGLMIPVDEQIDVLDKDYGGLPSLGTEMVDNHYHAGWAWATDTPFKSTKLVAAHFGGTRTPLAVAWPNGFAHDPTPRNQFHHVIDIAATIYDAVGIDPPAEVDGVSQLPIDGVSLVPSWHDANADSGRTTQYFEIMGSRGIYHDGWFAAAFGPRNPWDPAHNRFRGWLPDEDQWELYDLRVDFSQANDLAETEPDKLAELRALFDEHAEANQVFPIGGGLLTSVFRPDLMKSNPNTHWVFDGSDDRIAESDGPQVPERFLQPVGGAFHRRPRRQRCPVLRRRHHRRVHRVRRRRPGARRVQHRRYRAHHGHRHRARCRPATTSSPSSSTCTAPGPAARPTSPSTSTATGSPRPPSPARCRPCSASRRPSTSARTSAHRCRWPTPTASPSPSPAPSTRSSAPTSRPRSADRRGRDRRPPRSSWPPGEATFNFVTMAKAL